MAEDNVTQLKQKVQGNGAAPPDEGAAIEDQQPESPPLVASDPLSQQILNDFVVVENIIANCAQRGAFQASEMVLVGGVYQRVQQYIENLKATGNNDNTEEDQAAAKEDGASAAE